MSVFFEQLMNCVSSIRIEKDIIAAETLLKRPVDTAKYAPYDIQYFHLLTFFAFQKYHKETAEFENINFIDVDEQMALFGATPRERLITRSITCDCFFFTSWGLPCKCKQILRFRQLKEIDLFDGTICIARWHKNKMDTMTQMSYVLDDAPNIEVTQTASQQVGERIKHSYNQKYRLTKKKCDEICSLMAELPENQFQHQLILLADFLKGIQNICNQGIF